MVLTSANNWSDQDEKRLRSLIRLKLYRQKNEKLRYFIPNPAQKRWIDEISRENAFVVINAGGNGEGKTWGLVAALGAFMFDSAAPQCFNADIFHNFKGPKKIWVVSNPSELGETSAIQSAIDELWPKEMYEADKKGKQYKSVFRSKSGWVLELKSTEQHEREFRGSNVGIVALNEPIPERIYRECLARLRSGGLMLGAMTSLYDEPWIVDGLLNKHDGNDYRIIYGNVEENCKDHTPGGTLKHDQIEKILAQYPEDEREARRTGKPLSLSGRIFKSFDRNVHVREFEIINSGVSHGMVVDPAIGKPLAIVWRFVDAAGVLHYYDEFPNFEFQGAKDSNLTVSDYVELIKAREAGRKIDTRILDRHFGNVRRTLGGLTLKQEFEQAGISFTDSYTMEPAAEVEAGILKVKEYLKHDKTKPIDALNTPKIIIHPNCKNIISSFERWSRNPETGKPLEYGKDFMDCIRYDVMSNPAIETPRNWGTGKQPFYGVR